MSKPVVLPSKRFGSTKEAKAYFRHIHNEAYAQGDVISDPEHDQLLRELVKLHPGVEEKEGPGIREFFVEFTSRSGRLYVTAGQTGIWIRDVDGDERDFGYNKAIDQPDGAHVLRDALRNEVNDLRIKYREDAFDDGKPVVCPATGIEMTHWDQAEVRYPDPEWADLTEVFVNQNGGWSAIDTHGGNGGVQVGQFLVSDEVRAAWLDFWRENANPTIVATPTARRAAGL